ENTDTIIMQYKSQRHENIEQASNIECRHEHSQGRKRIQTISTYRKTHGAHGAVGRHAHDHFDDGKQTVQERLHHMQQRLRLISDLGKTEAEEYGKKQYLK